MKVFDCVGVGKNFILISLSLSLSLLYRNDMRRSCVWTLKYQMQSFSRVFIEIRKGKKTISKEASFSTRRLMLLDVVALMFLNYFPSVFVKQFVFYFWFGFPHLKSNDRLVDTRKAKNNNQDAHVTLIKSSKIFTLLQLYKIIRRKKIYWLFTFRASDA